MTVRILTLKNQFQSMELTFQVHQLQRKTIWHLQRNAKSGGIKTNPVVYYHAKFICKGWMHAFCFVMNQFVMYWAIPALAAQHVIVDVLLFQNFRMATTSPPVLDWYHLFLIPLGYTYIMRFLLVLIQVG